MKKIVIFSICCLIVIFIVSLIILINMNKPDGTFKQLNKYLDPRRTSDNEYYVGPVIYDKLKTGDHLKLVALPNIKFKYRFDDEFNAFGAYITPTGKIDISENEIYNKTQNNLTWVKL